MKVVGPKEKILKRLYVLIIHIKERAETLQPLEIHALIASSNSSYNNKFLLWPSPQITQVKGVSGFGRTSFGKWLFMVSYTFDTCILRYMIKGNEKPYHGQGPSVYSSLNLSTNSLSSLIFGHYCSLISSLFHSCNSKLYEHVSVNAYN